MFDAQSGVNVGVVGATGQVGGVMLDILAERGYPVATLRAFASSRSAGRTFAWGDKEVVVEDAATADFSGVDIALFSAGGGHRRGQGLRGGPACGEQDDVEPGPVRRGGVFDGDRRALPVELAAGRSRRREQSQLGDREGPLGEDPPHDPANLTRCTDDPYAHGTEATGGPGPLPSR